MLQGYEKAAAGSLRQGWDRGGCPKNRRYGEFIETQEREDIFMAMQKLYEECVLQGERGQADEKAAPMTISEIWDMMDEVREDW